MQKYEQVTLTGRSGAQHTFAILQRNTTFKAEPGVYVMARALGGNEYEIVLIGEKADLSKRPLDPDKVPCIDRSGVDHIFLIEERDQRKRADIVKDLAQAYGPVCNTL